MKNHFYLFVHQLVSCYIIRKRKSGKMVYCCVINCYNTSKVATFHRLPYLDEELYNEWLRRIQNQKLYDTPPEQVYKNCRVCSAHFNKYNEIPGSKKLKMRSVPTLLLPGFSEVPTESNSILEFTCFMEQQPVIEMQQAVAIIEEQPAVVKKKNRKRKRKEQKNFSVLQTPKVNRKDMSHVLPSEELHTKEKVRNNMELETQCNLSSSYEHKSEVVEDVKFNLEDLHHSIDIKDESDCESMEQTSNMSQELLSKELQIKENIRNNYEIKSEVVEDVKFTLEDLHHYIDIKDESDSEPIHEELTARKYNSSRQHFRVHTGEKAFSCKVCDFKCNRKYTLTIHLRIHTGEKAFSCEICEYKCNQKSNLNRHLRTHTRENPFSCKICDYKFNYKSNLKRHLTTHTGEKPFSCEICDYKCNQKSTLKSHLRTHTRENSFSCEICDYKSNQKSTLKRHLRRHIDERAFSCEICDYKM